MLLGFEEYEQQSKRLAEQLGKSYQRIAVHTFPDGESRVTLPQKLPEHTVICRSLNQPNTKLVELLLAARTARQSGVQRLTLVAPYLCYMRQDKAFNPGEAVSQKIIGSFLADLFDDVITVDPHLHRTQILADAVPAQQTMVLTATDAMRDFLRVRGNEFLLGPDAESEQWVRSIAEPAQLDYGVATKQRLGDREIRIQLPETALAGRSVVLVDDVISSGETVAVAASACIEKGASQVNVLVTHALFAAGAVERLSQAGINEIWSSDSIPHPSNCISLAGLLANAIRALV